VFFLVSFSFALKGSVGEIAFSFQVTEIQVKLAAFGLMEKKDKSPNYL
jgi:hypothetical protein